MDICTGCHRVKHEGGCVANIDTAPLFFGFDPLPLLSIGPDRCDAATMDRFLSAALAAADEDGVVLVDPESDQAWSRSFRENIEAMVASAQGEVVHVQMTDG